MWQKRLFAIMATVLLSGCSLSFGGSISEGGSIWKSDNAGVSFAPKIKIDDKQNISKSDVLIMEFHPSNPDIIYIGTLENGIFKSTDGAETWQKLEYPPEKVYGLIIDKSNGDRLYATGTYDGVGKIYRSDDAGKKWDAVYSEPGPKTVITALGQSPDNPGTLVAGTSAGVVIETRDGGATWKNFLTAKGPVTKVLFERGLPGMRTLLVWNEGTIVSSDGGMTWEDYSGETSGSFGESDEDVQYSNGFYDGSGTKGGITVRPLKLTTITSDPKNSAVIYGGGSNGLFRSENRGKTWMSVPIIESSKAFPVRAIAINPLNPSEISYGAGTVFYKSINGGITWSTADLLIERGMSTLLYHPTRPEVLYFTLRKY